MTRETFVITSLVAREAVAISRIDAYFHNRDACLHSIIDRMAAGWSVERIERRDKGAFIVHFVKPREMSVGQVPMTHISLGALGFQLEAREVQYDA